MILSVTSVNSSKITFRETNTKANSSITSLTEITYFINQEIDYIPSERLHVFNKVF